MQGQPSNRYYQSSPLCPICQDAKETFEHFLTCPHHLAQEARTLQLTSLADALGKLRTPCGVTSTILQGFQHWIHPPNSRSRAPTTGSLAGADIVLTAADHEQFHDLGWYQCSLGRISIKWQQAVEEYSRRDNLFLDSSLWASSFIQLLWSYTKNLWQHRNEFILGSTPEEEATKLLAKLHDQVSYHYAQFSSDPTYILPRQHHLFTQCTIV